ncbi:MAG: D-alanyl-D-alanine carboxypeptidase/D-alanyl-D-alanine-endopeptidase [Chitinophagales bacterium]
MKKIFLAAGCWLLVTGLSAQTITTKLQKAFQQFENDPQLKHAISSLYVIDAKTGKVVFDKNSQVGLAGASTQKIITATTAFELLGKDYRYKTQFIKRKDLHVDYGHNDGELVVQGNGDPTFGSQRYESTKVQNIFLNVLGNLQNQNFNRVERIVVPAYVNQSNPLPGGYCWEDIGNYYGAGTFSLDWRENQYDLLLKSTRENGSPPEIVGTEPEQKDMIFYNFLSTGERGSGDNAYIYSVPFSKEITVRGTIPPNQEKFIIAGSMPNPAKTFAEEFYKFLVTNSIAFRDTLGIDGKLTYFDDSILIKRDFTDYKDMISYMVSYPLYKYDTIYTHYSPSLDSIIYWFLKKSINLYGEALIKTFAYEKKARLNDKVGQGVGSTDSGVVIVKDFWKQKGLDETELNICDGSGLSPLNRITTHAQVEVLKYAKTRDWFPYFYDALPEYNNMKMKSGTINGVKGFAGYQTSKSGDEYIFSFLVNNYNGSPSELVDKMYKVLNNLK